MQDFSRFFRGVSHQAAVRFVAEDSAAAFLSAGFAEQKSY
jgi:hypothetical protein